MTTDEMRTAAEDVISWSRRGVIESAKAVAVAHALLSMLPPADDGEPITAANMDRAGLRVASGPGVGPGSFTLRVAHGRSSVDYILYSPGDAHVFVSDGDAGDYLPAGMVPTTMGQLRRLCAALGVPLNKPAPATVGEGTPAR